MLNFKTIDINCKQEIDEYLKNYNYIGTEGTFFVLFCWRYLFNFKYATEDGFLFITLKFQDRISYLFPIGEDNSEDKNATKEAVKKIIKNAEEQNIPFYLIALDDERKELLESIFPEKFNFAEDRNNYDYVYNQNDLQLLTGKKFHAQRNHINKFNLLYQNYKVEPITKKSFYECMEMNLEWCKANGLNTASICSGNNYELCAVNQAFGNFDALGCIGTLIRINDKVIAFTLGSERNKDVFVTHFEKALYEYDGAFKVINQEYAKVLGGYNYKFINREEDMGDEGLRHSKMSYNPAFMVKKYNAEIR
ncbi:MAG: hypothetical protein K0S55_1212 [Clostridia bacterium]|nr:hypothetical protein [Clostridia bacterium]